VNDAGGIIHVPTMHYRSA